MKQKTLRFIENVLRDTGVNEETYRSLRLLLIDLGETEMLLQIKCCDGYYYIPE